MEELFEYPMANRNQIYSPNAVNQIHINKSIEFSNEKNSPPLKNSKSFI